MKTLTPIFVIGTYHSGTTILYRMLAMNPAVTWLSQFSQRSGRIPGRQRLPLYTTIDRLSRRLFEHDWEETGGKGIRRFVVATPQEAQAVWQHVIPSEHPDPETCRERLLAVVAEESKSWKGNTHFLVKYPYLSLRVSVLRSILPEAKFIHIVRDGRAVALSLKSERLRSTFPRASADDQSQVLKNVAAYWVNVLSAIESERHAMDVLDIRYEDFCADVRGALRRLFRHVGVGDERFPYHRCPAELHSTNARWIAAADRESIAVIENIQHTNGSTDWNICNRAPVQNLSLRYSVRRGSF